MKFTLNKQLDTWNLDGIRLICRPAMDDYVTVPKTADRLHLDVRKTRPKGRLPNHAIELKAGRGQRNNNGTLISAATDLVIDSYYIPTLPGLDNMMQALKIKPGQKFWVYVEWS